MRISHAADSAKRHFIGQVPNDTLRNVPIGPLSCRMASDFRKALLWHMDHHDTGISDIVSATGVSRDVINKLKARENASTTVENAMLIAAYYGKTVNEFIALKDATAISRATALIEMLKPEERRLLEAQIRGLLAQRDAE